MMLMIQTSVQAETPTQESVTKLYVATFNRAPLQVGLDYWVNDSGLQLEDVAMSFFDQDETKAKYPTDSTVEDFIIAVYANLFNREPAAAGLEYWGGEINSGNIDKSVFILAVMNGAKDTDTSNDAMILANKTTVGLAFANAGLTDKQDAGVIMLGVTDDEGTVTAALARYDLEIQTTTAPTGVTASAGDDQITISWNAVLGATSYNIYWSTTSGVTKTNGIKITGVTSPYNHIDLTNGVTYFYVVTAANSYGESVESSEVSVAPKAWTITTFDTTGKYSSIAVDANKKVHISYYNSTDEKLMYLTNSSGSWMVTAVANAPSTAYGTSIAIDTNGKLHIAYEGTNGNVMYTTNLSGSWVSTIVESAAWSADVSLVLDSYNNVHISYFNFVNFNLKYATNSTGPWATFIIVNGGASGALPYYSTSIDLDSNNKVHISYYDDSASDSIRYITNASGSWQITQIDTIGLAAGWETSLVVDSSNKVHISYYNWTDDALKYATNSSGAWQTNTVDNTSGGVWYAAITADSSKNVHISYGSYAGLMYATNFSGSWVASNIDEAWTGSYSSIAVDTGGGIHISYYDGYNLDLKYATK